MDPLNQIPLAARPQVYAQWRDAAAWGLDVCEARGARITFLSVGEYMEYTLEDPASWALIDQLRRSGGTIGTHSHQEKKFGPHDWRDLPSNAPMSLIVEAWHDHVDAVDAVLTAIYGITLPQELRAINNARGTHLPADHAARIALMAQFGFTIHQQGPDEEFYGYFGHYAMNPYRPAGDHFLRHDPEGPVVVSPFGPVLGKDGIHFGIYQDMRLPAVKTIFLITLLNWLDDVYVAGSGRVWDFGWGAHGSDLLPGQPTRAALEPMLDWLKELFVDETPGGRRAVEFSSVARSRDMYLAWEAAHPGWISFSYPASETNWARYPYLLPVARYLVGGQYDSTLLVNRVRLHKVMAGPQAGGPYPLFVAYSLGPQPAVVNLGAVLGPGRWVAVSPRTGLAPLIAPEHVRVPPNGVVLVPEDKRLALPNGDVNLDGRLDFRDINPFARVVTGADPDPQHRAAADINRDGVADLADVNPFVHLLTHQ